MYSICMRKTRNSQYDTEEVQVRRRTLHVYETYYKAAIIKTVCFGWKNRHIDQYNWDPEIDPCKQPIDVWQRSKRNSMEKAQPFPQIVLKQIDIHM